MKTKSFSGFWPYGRTLKILILVFCVISIVSITLVGCVPLTSIAVSAPTEASATPTEVVEVPTVAVTLEPTLTPTIVMTPTPTPTPVNFGWPILQDMPYGEERAELERSFAEDPNLVKQVEEPRFRYVFSYGLVQLLVRVKPTIMIDYADRRLPSDLHSFLEVWYHDTDIQLDSDEDGDPILLLTPSEYSEPLVDYSLLVYEYAHSDSRGICQFFEAATLEGYGYAIETDFGEASNVVEGIAYLSNGYGDPSMIGDQSKLYCSNFNPASTDFLSIAVSKGYVDVIAQVRQKLNEN